MNERTLSFSALLRFLSRFLVLMLFTVLLSAPAMAVETAEGRDIVFALDMSGSMIRTDPERYLLQAVSSCLQNLSQGDSRAAVVPFSDRLGEELPMTDLDGAGKDTALSFVDSLTYTSGDTDIGLALEEAVKLLKDSTDRDRRVVLVTDGMIDLPHTENELASEKDSLTKALVAAENAKNSGILIDTAGVGDPDRIDSDLLGYLAGRTGGNFIQSDPSALADTLAAMVSSPRQVPAAETEEAAVQTEAETQTELQTPETEKRAGETETELPPAITAPPVIGSVTGQVKLSGFIPQMASSSVNLHDLFDYSDFDMEPHFSAQAADPSILAVRVENGSLKLSGRAEGVTTVRVAAEREGSQSDTQFEVKVEGIMNLHEALMLTGLAAAGIFLLVLVLRGGMPHRYSSGTFSGKYKNKGTGRKLRFYVKMDNQKIFGVPTQNTVDLPAESRAVRLSDLISDPYLETADLRKVLLRPSEHGAVLVSRSQECVIRDQDGNAVRKLNIEEGSRFRILCATDMGTAVIVAICVSADRGSERKDEQDDRTRLLV